MSGSPSCFCKALCAIPTFVACSGERGRACREDSGAGSGCDGNSLDCDGNPRCGRAC